MKEMIRIMLMFSLSSVLMIVRVATGSAPETAGQVLWKLNKLLPEKRQEALIAGAKAEGEVTWYSSTQAVQIGPIAKAFNKRFPFLKVNRYRVSGQKQVVKIQSVHNIYHQHLS